MSEQAELRKKFNLPYRCECGGLMEYEEGFGRIWSACRQCSPVVHIDTSRPPFNLRKETPNG